MRQRIEDAERKYADLWPPTRQAPRTGLQGSGRGAGRQARPRIRTPEDCGDHDCAARACPGRPSRAVLPEVYPGDAQVAGFTSRDESPADLIGWRLGDELSPTSDRCRGRTADGTNGRGEGDV